MKKPHKFGMNDRWTETELLAAFMRMCLIEPRLAELASRVKAKADATKGSARDMALWYDADQEELERFLPGAPMVVSLDDMDKWLAPEKGYKPGRGSFKYQMSRLAGWNSPHAALRTQEAYDTAYDFLAYYLIQERQHQTVPA